MPTVSDFTALLGINDNASALWNGVTDIGTAVIVTYSFADGENVPTIAESSYTVASTFAFTLAQRQNFRLVTQEFERQSGVVFVEIEEGGMIDISNVSGSPWGGWASYPYATDNWTSLGTLIIDKAGEHTPGSSAYQTMLHELGHAMGLQHPHTGTVTLAASFDTQYHTVMTYNNNAPYTTVLGTLDVEALQYLYGSTVNTTGWVTSYDNVNLVLSVTGGNLADVILGVAGDNDLRGGKGGDTIFGRENNDTLSGQGGKDYLVGMLGNDTIYGNVGADTLYGDSETESPYNGGADFLSGGQGNDTLFGNSGADVLQGGAGSDELYGGAYDDTLLGGKGRDLLNGDDSSDLLKGGAGGDSLDGGEGWDTLYGGQHKDTLFGGTQNDTLYGGKGEDVLFGGSGWDTLSGGRGRDTLTGGADRDTFHFDNKSGKDRITDFEDGFDRIDISDGSFSFSDLKFRGRNGGVDTVITVDGYNVSIYLEHVTKAELSSYDFFL